MPISDSRPVRLALRAWFAFRLLRLRSHPHPTDVPAVRSGDPRADRVLLVGNGPSHGWGVLSHQLALTGRLAAAVGDGTGRPCDVDLIGAEAMDVRSALSWIGDRDLTLDDAVVLVVGFNDALRLTPLPVWRREIARLLDALASRLAVGASLVIAGIPPIGAFSPFGTLGGQASEHHRRRMNVVTRQLAARRGIPFVDLVVDADTTPETAYAGFAAELAGTVAPLLRVRRPEAAARPERPERTWDWSGTAAIVDAARTGGEPELRRLAERAQKAFDVELAVVSLADGDRLFHGTNTDVMPASVPLELSFCRYTVESDDVVVIPDTGRDPRFQDNPLVDVSFINFYAGYPLHASDGHVIGSFCIQGSRSRKASSVDLDGLERMAHEAETVLHRYESMPLPTGPAYQLG